MIQFTILGEKLSNSHVTLLVWISEWKTWGWTNLLAGFYARHEVQRGRVASQKAIEYRRVKPVYLNNRIGGIFHLLCLSYFLLPFDLSPRIFLSSPVFFFYIFLPFSFLLSFAMFVLGRVSVQYKTWTIIFLFIRFFQNSFPVSANILKSK